MALEDDIAFFEQVPSLATLGKQALRVLAIGAESRRLASGAVLFYAGELADGGYIVLEGSLVVESGTPPQSREFTVGPGTMLGELSLLTGTISPVTAIAKEPTTVIRISRGLFRKMLEGYPAAARRFRDMLEQRLGSLTQDLEEVQRKLDRDGKPR
jgi:CRP-like cAMP-binding protein